MNPSIHDKIEGLFLGTAVGDTIGLPMEGMRPYKIHKLGWARKESLRHRFLPGCGMWSDDTEHTIMLTQALLASGGDEEKFARCFAAELRWWLAAIPAAAGLATVQAILKLWLGFPPHKSGVFSAGNGPAMRAAPVAAFFPNDPKKRKRFAEKQTRITHTDPKALIGTLAVTELAALFLNSETPPDTRQILATLYSISPDSRWTEIIQVVEVAVATNQNIEAILPKLGGISAKGVSGYIYQTLPAVFLAGIRNQWNFETTIAEVIASGGDTDTTAAIAGALCGACRGAACIPKPWIEGIREWPVHIRHLHSLASAVSRKDSFRIRPRWSLKLILRNLFFLIAVIYHGIIRLLR